MPLLHASALRPETVVNFTAIPDFLVAGQQAFLNQIALSEDGSTIVIGRGFTTIDGVFNAGEAYIYEKNSCSWTITYIAAPSNFKVSSGEFGYSVGISRNGSTVVIAARRHVLSSSDAGGVAVFRKSGGVWQLVYQFLRNVNGDNVGKDLAVSQTGTRFIVGRPGGFGSGIVFNEISPDVWESEQFLLPSSAGAADRCGERVDLLPDMSFALTGNPNDDIAGSNRGGATVYQRSGNTWTQTQNFTSSVTASTGDEFGKDIAVSDDGLWLAVGDWSSELGATNAGMVAIFENVAGTYTERQLLQRPSGAGSSQFFGEHINLNDDGTLMTIGSRNTGTVYVYERIGISFVHRQSITGGGNRGHGLSPDGNVLVIGGAPNSFLYYDTPPVHPSYASYALGLTPTIWYRFDDVSPTTVVVDNSGASNATYVGSPTLGAAGALVNESDNAVGLNGSTQYIDMDTAAPMANMFDDTGQSSFSAWVYPQGLIGIGATIANRFLSSQVGWELLLTNEVGDSRVRFVQQRFTDPDSWQTDQLIPLNTWSLIMLVYDVASGTPQIYVNGEAQTVNVVNAGAGTRGNDTLGETFLGRTGAGLKSFNGRFDEFKFFKGKLLSDIEVAELYCLGRDMPVVVPRIFDEGALEQSSAVLSEASEAFRDLISVNDDGSVIVIGDWDQDVGVNNDQGEVTVWEKGLCSYAAIVLSAPPIFTLPLAEFGRAVAVSGDGSTVAIGVRRSINNALDAGGLSIWRKVSGIWTALQNIEFTVNTVLFGQTMVLTTTGDRLIIGAQTVLNPDGAGVVYVESVANTWTVEQELVPTTGGALDRIGDRVTISSDGQYALVGSTNDDLAGSDRGGASLWSRSGTVWSQLENFTAAVTATDGEGFGRALALSDDGTLLVVGDYLSNLNVTDAGYVATFDRTGTLTEKQTLQRPGGATSGNNFGEHIQLSNDATVLAIGSRALGHVYLHKKQGDSYFFSQRVTASGNGGFGLSGDGKVLVVGDSPNSQLYELEAIAVTTTYLDYAVGLGPTIYYRFGESGAATVAIDNSGNHNATYVGSPTLGSAGAIANDADTAVELDGVTQYISLGSPTIIDNMFDASGQSSFTIWTYFTGADNMATVLVDRYGSVNVGWVFVISWNTGDYRLIFQHRRATVSDQFSVLNAPLVNNQWQHLALTYDVASGAPNMYIDGVAQPVAQTLVGSGVFGNDAASPTFIGQNQDTTSRFTGRLDEAKFFKGTVLTPTQVGDLACIGTDSIIAG